MTRSRLIAALVAAGLVVAGAVWLKTHPDALDQINAKLAQPASETEAGSDAQAAADDATAPAITAIRVQKKSFVETVLVTGSLVARDEIVVAPELEGLKIVELKADEGDRVEQGDILAILQDAALKHQVAQRKASLKRAAAAVEQAKAQIKEAAARKTETAAALARAKPLRRQKYIAESVIDQRRSSAISASAQLASAKEGLSVAEAHKAEIDSQLQELEWRLSRTILKAPVAGLISKRNARVGEIAIGANAFSADAPMFRLIARNEVELEAEVPEAEIAKIDIGQNATVTVAGVGRVDGTVRLVSPEIDKSTRLGEVRIFLGDDRRLKLGSFGRGIIKARQSEGLAIPLSAVAYGADGARVLVIEGNTVRAQPIDTGLIADGMVEVSKGLNSGDIVVAKAATFLRDGDKVKPMLPDPKVSEARR
jgi:HlyD family secretion protein